MLCHLNIIVYHLIRTGTFVTYTIITLSAIAIITFKRNILFFIFGVFLVDEAYEGDNREEGYVTTTSKYKISLSLDEAKQMLFWNYYHNENAIKLIPFFQLINFRICKLHMVNILCKLSLFIIPKDKF